MSLLVLLYQVDPTWYLAPGKYQVIDYQVSCSTVWYSEIKAKSYASALRLVDFRQVKLVFCKTARVATQSHISRYYQSHKLTS